MRLKIELPTSWAQQRDQEGPATFCRQNSTNAFQVSWAEYRGKEPLQWGSTEDLTQFATEFGQKSKFGALLEASGGLCRFGRFGTAVFSAPDYPRIQVWIISDGTDQILATHICDRDPDETEIAEVQQIASSLALGPETSEKPWWRFW